MSLPLALRISSNICCICLTGLQGFATHTKTKEWVLPWLYFWGLASETHSSDTKTGGKNRKHYKGRSQGLHEH